MFLLMRSHGCLANETKIWINHHKYCRIDRPYRIHGPIVSSNSGTRHNLGRRSNFRRVRYRCDDDQDCIVVLTRCHSQSGHP